MDALSLMNNTKSLCSSTKLNYTQIVPIELEYISMDEIIRVCFYVFLL
jgi:hypothetical protein